MCNLYMNNLNVKPDRRTAKLDGSIQEIKRIK
jgi:hypothetical protein